MFDGTTVRSGLRSTPSVQVGGTSCGSGTSGSPIALSVVVPTHGRTDLFLQTLDSLRQQTFARFEIVVTDDSPDIGDRQRIHEATIAYADETGRPARYRFSAPRLGQARNTNQGLALAAGDLVRILHSDDVLAPAALETEVAVMNDERLGLDVLFHHPQPFVDTPRFDRQPALAVVQPSLLFRSTLHSQTPLPSATVFRRPLLADVGPMRDDLDFLCDWEFFARLLIAQHRRHRFIGMFSAGLVGWRVHPNSTTGRLWDRHFLEHERFIADLEADTGLCESLIGDEQARAVFFARAVRYRYRRLREDVQRMTWPQARSSWRRILGCALSRDSLRDRLRPAPWTAGPLRRPSKLVVAVGAAAADRTAASSPRIVEPRQGWRFVASAYASAAIIRWGKAHAAKRGLTPVRSAPPRELTDDTSAARPAPGAMVALGDRVEVRPSMDAAALAPGQVAVLTEYNNTTNLWPLRGLLRDAHTVGLTGVNDNAYVEPVLHQLLKLVPVDATIEARIRDNEHLTAFGFKSLIDKLFPGQFSWIGQQRQGPAHHLLQYRRSGAGHPAYMAPHTGWTFGMLTTGTRLANVERFIDSIERHCREPYEILIVSPNALGALEMRPHVRVLRFGERDDLGWITRKKNLIASEARYSDILICHDRFWLTDDFTTTFAAWGYAYGLAAMRVKLPDGSRGLDWAVVSSQNHVWSSGGLLDYRACSQYAYNPGGATIIRKAFWRDFPWNENLFWNEHEDVELCRRVQRAGGIIALAASTLVTAEDRWVHANPRIPYCDQNEVLYGEPVGEQRIRFLTERRAA